MLKPSKSADQSAQILSLLQELPGTWIPGSHLVSVSGTSALGARLRGLRTEGWLIEARTDPKNPEGFSQYRLVGRGEPKGRTQVFIQLPEVGRAWTEEEAEVFRKEAQSSVDFLYATKYKETPKPKLDYIDLLLQDGILDFAS